jgi:hypothetical protein
MMGEKPGPSLSRRVFALVLFGVAFGYVEGSVVVYLRAFYDPLHEKIYPDSPSGDLFPLVTLSDLQSEGFEHLRRLTVELGREGMTLVLLAAVPLTFSKNFREWIAGFMIGFGVWDLTYYGVLKLVLDWPESWLTWDILFLLPVPWSGPVLAPCLVSISIIGAGVILLHREAADRPIPLRSGHWLAIVLGGVIVVVSFCWEARSVASGAMPGPFPWWVFGLGEGLGIAAFGQACLVDS